MHAIQMALTRISSVKPPPPSAISIRGSAPGGFGAAIDRSAPPSGNPPPPSLLYPDLPVGGDYGSILTYWVRKNVPTFRFAGLPADQACVALGFEMLVAFILLSCGYLYLDKSMVPNASYWINLYLGNGRWPGVPGSGPVSGSAGPLTLISTDPGAAAPADGYCPFFPPLPGTDFDNPNLVQVSFGQAPLYVAGQ